MTMKTTALTGDSTTNTNGQVADDVQRRAGPPPRPRFLQARRRHLPQARRVQADPLEEQHRDQQVGLIAEDQPLDAPAGPRPAAGERQHAEHDVGVGVLGVRVGVVAVVLGRPPAVAEPDGQVPAQHAEHVVGAPRAEDLVVPGVMAEEAQLAEDHRQVHGDRPAATTSRR